MRRHRFSRLPNAPPALGQISRRRVSHRCRGFGSPPGNCARRYHAVFRRAHLPADCAMFAKKVVLTKRIRWFEDSNGSPSFNHCWIIRDRQHRGPATLAYTSHDLARRDVKSTASPGTKVRGLERMPPWEGPFADPTRRAAASTGRGGAASSGTTAMAGASATPRGHYNVSPSRLMPGCKPRGEKQLTE